MHTPVHPITDLNLPNGAVLGLMPCPGVKAPPLEQALVDIQAWGADAVLTLMEPEELARHGVAELGERVQALGLRWFHLPIEDDHAPEAAFEQAWARQQAAILALLRQGGKLALHCKGGSGRTGLVATRLLLALGWELKPAMATVKALRPNALSLPVHQQWIADQAARLG